ncbi:MAG: MMPL family transporter [Pseudonocardiaceae bacterium]
MPRTETVDSDGTAVVEAVHAAVRTASGADVGATGSGAAVMDYSSTVYDNFPYVLLIIAAITIVALARTFRSVLLPVKAVALNLVSLAAVFGSVVFFWQQGHGSHAVFGVAPTGAISFWLPVIIFAFLFGLSMDYEVFILARMREEYDATGSTSAAVISGLGRTGRLVTSAALILFFSFAALASAPGTDIKVLGTALGAGILIDALVGTPVTLIDTVGRQVAVVRTGPDGSYRMTVPAGVYLLVASAIGHHPGAFVVTVADRPVGHEFVLPDLDSADPRLPRPAGRSVPAPARAGP